MRVDIVRTRLEKLYLITCMSCDLHHCNIIMHKTLIRHRGELHYKVTFINLTLMISESISIGSVRGDRTYSVQDYRSFGPHVTATSTQLVIEVNRENEDKTGSNLSTKKENNESSTALPSLVPAVILVR